MRVFQNALLLAIKESMNITMEEDSIPLSRSFASKITLDSKNFVIVTNKILLKKFAQGFLSDNNPDRETLIDISKEITNIIVGKAKVLYEENGKILKLGIPSFLGNKAISKYNKGIYYKYKYMRCSIYEI